MLPRTKDIFDRLAERDATPLPPRLKKVRLYQVAYGGTATVESKVSYKLYPRTVATKIAKRLERRGCPAYIAPVNYTAIVPA